MTLGIIRHCGRFLYHNMIHGMNAPSHGSLFKIPGQLSYTFIYTVSAPPEWRNQRPVYPSPAGIVTRKTGFGSQHAYFRRWAESERHRFCSFLFAFSIFWPSFLKRYFWSHKWMCYFWCMDVYYKLWQLLFWDLLCRGAFPFGSGKTWRNASGTTTTNRTRTEQSSLACVEAVFCGVYIDLTLFIKL